MRDYAAALHPDGGGLIPAGISTSMIVQHLKQVEARIGKKYTPQEPHFVIFKIDSTDLKEQVGFDKQGHRRKPRGGIEQAGTPKERILHLHRRSSVAGLETAQSNPHGTHICPRTPPYFALSDRRVRVLIICSFGPSVVCVPPRHL